MKAVFNKFKNMKNTGLIFTFLALFVTASVAQEYEDLKSLYLDGKYDKLVDKAEKYTKKEKSMNDPLPYLYMAKGLFKISGDERFKNQEMYKTAEMDALSKFQIYKKKDKGNVYKDIADPFLAEVKTQVYEETENFYSAKNYKKALANMKKIIKFEPENQGALIVKGLCEYGTANKTEGKKNIELAITHIKNMKNFEDMSTEDKHLMEYSLMEYTNFLVNAKDFSGAKSAITLGYQYFKGEEHKEYEDLYNKVVNG